MRETLTLRGDADMSELHGGAARVGLSAPGAEPTIHRETPRCRRCTRSFTDGGGTAAGWRWCRPRDRLRSGSRPSGNAVVSALRELSASACLAGVSQAEHGLSGRADSASRRTSAMGDAVGNGREGKDGKEARSLVPVPVECVRFEGRSIRATFRSPDGTRCSWRSISRV